jgi:hypothetical protein
MTMSSVVGAVYSRQACHPAACVEALLQSHNHRYHAGVSSRRRTPTRASLAHHKKPSCSDRFLSVPIPPRATWKAPVHLDHSSLQPCSRATLSTRYGAHHAHGFCRGRTQRMQGQRSYPSIFIQPDCICCNKCVVDVPHRCVTGNSIYGKIGRLDDDRPGDRISIGTSTG